MADYTTPAITVLTGIGLGFYAHWLTRKRDTEARQYAADAAKQTRKDNFLGFLEGWRTEIERNNIHFTADAFTGRCAQLRSEATKIRPDYEPKFWELVDSLSSLHGGEIKEGANQGDNAPGRRELFTRLDTVANFVKAN